jgi:hypothetical protein
VILVMAVLFVALLSPIAPVLLIPVVIGSWLASIRAWRSKEPGKAATPFTGPAIARIDSSRITISGGLGAGILIVMLLGSVMIELPELRLWATPGLLAGLVVAVALRLWRRWHPRDMTKDWVSIKLGDVDQIQARRDSRRS